MAQYRRRAPSVCIMHEERTIDNSWVVPYSGQLHAHIVWHSPYMYL